MIRKGILKVGDVVFIYSQPIKNAMVGIVRSIDYPMANLLLTKEKNKQITIDLSVNIPLSVLDKNRIKQFLTSKERKVLQEAKQVIIRDEQDLFD